MTWFQCGGSNLTCFLCRGGMDLVVLWVVEIDLFSNARRKSLVFCVSMQIDLHFVCVVQIHLIFIVGDRTWLDSRVRWNGFGCCVGCRKWHNFSVVDRHWFGFRVTVENDWFVVSGSKFTGFLCREIDVDLVVEWGSKLTWFQWWSSNRLGFVWTIEIESVLVWGPKLTCFCAEVKIDLVFVCGSKNTWF